ncbi:MAG: DCC1-like thiol-disulfide oxidoreductase family protein [Leptospira sp.]|nr:DCC1-like thiol-disulfide oxidoreductase family protein [Leptospira sp.]
MSLLVLDWSSKTLKPVWISEGISQMENRKIVFFDGVCNLCTGSVQWILKRNKKKDLYFSQIGGDTYNLIQKDIPENFPTIDSILYYNGNVILVESEAILTLSKSLDFPYSLLTYLVVIPKFIRDFFYRFVAKHRYRWFGRSEFCLLPNEETNSRFLP